MWIPSKKVYQILELSIWEPFIDQPHDIISLVNTESKKWLKNSKIQVLKDISFLDFNLKLFLKHLYDFSKFCLIIISIQNIISRNSKIRDSSIREYLNVDDMINFDLLVFKNYNYCIKETIPLSYCWISTLNSICELYKKGTVTPIKMEIRIIIFKLVKIIGWWTDTGYLMNWSICVIESITDIQYPFSESMHIIYSNVYPEWISMCYWTIILIKVSSLDLRTPMWYQNLLLRIYQTTH